VPPPISRQHSFTDWQSDHPTQPLPGDWVDAEFDQSNDTINLVEDRLALIQRDDGGLANQVVTPDSLSDDVLALVNEAQQAANQAALDAAASAQAAASSAAASASEADMAAASADAAASAAAAGFAYEQGAQTAATNAQASANAAAASAATFPPL